jgi:hypothetical protein
METSELLAAVKATLEPAEGAWTTRVVVADPLTGVEGSVAAPTRRTWRAAASSTYRFPNESSESESTPLAAPKTAPVLLAVPAGFKEQPSPLDVELQLVVLLLVPKRRKYPVARS